MLHFAFLLVCHNRRDGTLLALEALQAATAAQSVKVSVFVFDDASTDGTAEAVRAVYPQATIVSGDGTAFWNKGLNDVWRTALSLEADAFVWMNDDVILGPGALAHVRSAWEEAQRRRADCRFILVGATSGAAGEISYGGKRRVRSPWALRLRSVDPTGRLEAIDTFNGNFVVVSRAVINVIGLNDPAYFHNMGDIDYGLRAKRAGIDVWLLPEPIGNCPDNTAKAKLGFSARDLSLFQQWQKVNTYHGVPFRSWARLTFRHSGMWFPLHFFLAYRRLVIPRWVMNLFDSKWTIGES